MTNSTTSDGKSESKSKTNLLKQGLKGVGRGLTMLNPLRWLWRGWFNLSNRLRKRAKIDYVTFRLGGEIPPLPEERGFIQERILGEAPTSLVELGRHFERIGKDPRPKGVILYLRGLALASADMQTLRDSILRLRQMGKRVICYAQEYDMRSYFLASAADEIILQPGGMLMTLGTSVQLTFLKDALDQVGLKLDAVAISPYKGALDQFSRNDISAEGREQWGWLLDSRYDYLVKTIAEDRKRTPDDLRAMIDSAPHLDTTALTARYVDAVMNDEELPKHLNAEYIVPWAKAKKQLLKQWRKPHRQYVALLPITGGIIQGESRQPPPIPLPVPIPFFGEESAGDVTVVQQVRNLMQNEEAAAVVLFVDSPGGSALASEAMTSALEQLAKSRPLVVYMNNVAASGGYYIATPAHWIVAQPGTITGSIGVLSGKPISTGLFDKLHVTRRVLERGENVNMFSDLAPFSDAERRIVRGTIERIYEQFTERVANSRKITIEQVDAIGAGRVWTGLQAKDNGLVDEIGDLQAALRKARELANLSDDVPLVLFQDKPKIPLPPQLAKEANPATGLAYLYERIRQTFNGSVQALMPYDID